MTRGRLAPPVVALVAVLAACRGGSTTSPEPVSASPPADAAAASPKHAASRSGGSSPLAKASVTLYFPSVEGNALVAETREIVDTKRPDDRGAQILAALLEGPQAEGALAVFPDGTTLRRCWVRDDGNAFADFSDELLGAAASGGSADEILTVYAIVNSLTANVPEIHRVGILVAGRERATFGHLDLSRPLRPDLSLAAGPKATE